MPSNEQRRPSVAVPICALSKQREDGNNTVNMRGVSLQCNRQRREQCCRTDMQV